MIVVGESFAGLAAATYIAHGRRSVCVVDAGGPRNRFAAASHGFLGQDGSDPRTMLAQARANSPPLRRRPSWRGRRSMSAQAGTSP